MLVVQTILALRLVWSNTAFADESLYLWAGRLEWAHWLHHAAVPDFATYFSGAPVIYPPLGAAAEAVGGLAAARLLSLCFMLGVTSLLYSVTRRLFSRRAAGCAAGIFAVLGPAQFLTAFATYDAMAIFLMALASYLVVRAATDDRPCLFVAAGIVLALAIATKYATALWAPVVIATAALAAPPRRWPAAVGRAALVGCSTAAPLLLGLFVLGGSSYVRGVMFTTLARQAGSTPASAATVLGDSFSWVGVVLLLAVIGTATSFYSSTGSTRWLCLVLTGAVLLAPLHQAQIHTTTSLHKHVVFGAWFGAIVAGYLLDRAAAVNVRRGWQVGAVAAAIVAFVGVPQATQMFVYGWPNTSLMNAELAMVIPRDGCPCLVSEQNQLRYYLPKVADGRDVIGPYSFFYWDKASRSELSGLPAYEAAIRQRYFSVVEIDPAENLPTYGPIVRTLESTKGYRLDSTIAIDHWGRKTMQIWSRSPMPSSHGSRSGSASRSGSVARSGGGA